MMIGFQKNFQPRQMLELTKIPYITKFSFGKPLAVLEHSLSDPEFPGFYLNNVSRLIASDFSEAQQILAPNTRSSSQFEKTNNTIKELLAKPSKSIRLYDLVSGLLRQAADKLDQKNFPTSGELTNEEFATRIQRYEEAISDLTTATVLLGRWASPDQLHLLDMIFERVAEFEKPGAGLNVWLRLYRYPILMLMTEQELLPSLVVIMRAYDQFC